MTVGDEIEFTHSSVWLAALVGLDPRQARALIGNQSALRVATGFAHLLPEVLSNLGVLGLINIDPLAFVIDVVKG